MFARWNRQSSQGSTIKANRKKKAKKLTKRGVWAPMLVKGGSSFVLYDEPTTKMLHQEWQPREKDDSLTFSSQSVGNRRSLQSCATDDTDDTVTTIEEEEEKTIQLLVRQRAKALPRGPGAFGGNHVLINRERVTRGIKPLCRQKKLDEVAAKHAKKLSLLDELHHSSLGRILDNILQDGPCRLLGENISKGKSSFIIHDNMMLRYAQDRNNILDRRYTAFGVGSAKSSSGDLYIVQLYKG